MRSLLRGAFSEPANEALDGLGPRSLNGQLARPFPKELFAIPNLWTTSLAGFLPSYALRLDPVHCPGKVSLLPKPQPRLALGVGVIIGRDRGQQYSRPDPSQHAPDSVTV